MNVSQRTSVTIPLGENATPARFITFHQLSDQREHLAILFGEPERQTAPWVRLHSECLTGDVFASRRCDCGEQLKESQEIMAQRSGILLYLRQEGRGIGLYNKLDAYALQDQGFDTFTANEMLGFESDQRDFRPAAEMLLSLGVTQVQLLSNNPKKAIQLEALGVQVVNRQQTGVYANPHNLAYLKSKVTQQAHKIQLNSDD